MAWGTEARREGMAAFREKRRPQWPDRSHAPHPDHQPGYIGRRRGARQLRAAGRPSRAVSRRRPGHRHGVPPAGWRRPVLLQRVLHYVDFLDLKLSKHDEARLSQMLEHLPAELTLVCSQAFDPEDAKAEQRAMKSAAYSIWSSAIKVDDRRDLCSGTKPSAF